MAIWYMRDILVRGTVTGFDSGEDSNSDIYQDEKGQQKPADNGDETENKLQSGHCYLEISCLHSVFVSRWIFALLGEPNEQWTNKSKGKNE